MIGRLGLPELLVCVVGAAALLIWV